MELVPFILFLASAASYKPVPPIKCGVNEYVVPCKTICPPQNCDIAYTQYKCDQNRKCIPGCDCIENHLRNNDKICVYKEKCPPKPILPEDSLNVTSTNSSSESTSANVSTSVSSSSSSFSSSRHSSDCGGGVNRRCTYNRCTPTCSLPFPQNCPQNSNPCNCPLGTIISEQGGNCVPRQECQKYSNCKGDYNSSYTDCPIACPSTCAKPNAEYCDTKCGNLGCECNPGYLLNEINGTCIDPEDCPGGNACGKNETFVGCLIVCSNIYCPVDDDRAIIVCDPAYPCPSGCSCKRNYLRKSVDDNTCILASNCPPVNCTRPNEEWNPCPETCFSDYCSERNKVTKPGECTSSGPHCRPQCICKHGFFRNGTDICVKAQECPPEN